LACRIVTNESIIFGRYGFGSWFLNEEDLQGFWRLLCKDFGKIMGGLCKDYARIRGVILEGFWKVKLKRVRMKNIESFSLEKRTIFSNFKKRGRS
jgi:hypothetical protein